MGVLLTGCGGNQAAPTPTRAVNVRPGATAALRTAFIVSDPALVRGTGRPQVIVFYQVNCDQCQTIRPFLHALEDQYHKTIDFIYLDVTQDNTKQLQKDFNTTGTWPTVVFLSADGNEEARLIGVHSQQEIADKVAALLMVG